MNKQDLVHRGGVLDVTVLYIRSDAVILAKAGIQLRNTGFRVKPGMTQGEKSNF